MIRSRLTKGEKKTLIKSSFILSITLATTCSANLFLSTHESPKSKVDYIVPFHSTVTIEAKHSDRGSKSFIPLEPMS